MLFTFLMRATQSELQGQKVQMSEKCHIFNNIIYAIVQFGQFCGWFWKPKPSPFHWCMTSYMIHPKSVSKILLRTRVGRPILVASSKNSYFFSAQILIDSYLIYLFDASHTERATWPKGPKWAKIVTFLKISATLSSILSNLLAHFESLNLPLSLDV